MRIDSDRSWDMPVDVATLWDAIGDPSRYPTWWPWLRRIDADGLRAGARWTCVVVPPLPYVVRVVVTITDVVEGELVVASVGGDVAGDARLRLEAATSGSRLHLTSTLEPRRPLLRGLSAVAPAAARFGHEWVVESGGRQLAEHLREAP